MKRLCNTAKIFIFLLLSVLLLASCDNGGGAGNESQQPPVTESKYHTLKYEGMDVNPQQHYAKYEVGSDRAFVDEVWNAVKFDEWKAKDKSESAAPVAIWLRFVSADEVVQLSIDPNDEGCHTVSDVGHYYDLPEGTYDKISKLLTEYTEGHFNNALTPDALCRIMKEWDRYTFESDTVYYQVTAENAGDFMSKWDLEQWTQFTPEVGENFGNNAISIRHTPNPDLDVVVYTDTLNVWVTNKGASTYYKITQEIADTIQRQFEELEKLSEPR